MVLYRLPQLLKGDLALCLSSMAAQRSIRALIYGAEIWMWVYSKSAVSNWVQLSKGAQLFGSVPTGVGGVPVARNSPCSSHGFAGSWT